MQSHGARAPVKTQWQGNRWGRCFCRGSAHAWADGLGPEQLPPPPGRAPAHPRTGQGAACCTVHRSVPTAAPACACLRLPASREPDFPCTRSIADVVAHSHCQHTPATFSTTIIPFCERSRGHTRATQPKMIQLKVWPPPCPSHRRPNQKH